MDEKCKRIMECLSDYIDGDLSEDICRVVEEHLNQCNECKCIMENLKSTVKLLHSLPEEKIPENLEKNVLDNLIKILFK